MGAETLTRTPWFRGYMSVGDGLDLAAFRGAVINVKPLLSIADWHGYKEGIRAALKDQAPDARGPTLPPIATWGKRRPPL